MIEHAAHHRANHPITRERSRREAAVDDRRLDPAGAALAQQVRPDLGLHHDEELRPHQVERAAHDEGEVEREIKHRVDVRHVPARQLLPRHRRRRQEHAKVRIAPLQVADERPRRQHFADRDRVDPDRFVAVHVEGHGQVAHPLAEAADILLVAQRLVDEPRRGDHRHDEHENAVKAIHSRTYELYRQTFGFVDGRAVNVEFVVCLSLCAEP